MPVDRQLIYLEGFDRLIGVLQPLQKDSAQGVKTCHEPAITAINDLPAKGLVHRMPTSPMQAMQRLNLLLYVGNEPVDDAACGISVLRGVGRT